MWDLFQVLFRYFKEHESERDSEIETRNLNKNQNKKSKHEDSYWTVYTSFNMIIKKLCNSMLW